MAASDSNHIQSYSKSRASLSTGLFLAASYAVNHDRMCLLALLHVSGQALRQAPPDRNCCAAKRCQCACPQLHQGANPGQCKDGCAGGRRWRCRGLRAGHEPECRQSQRNFGKKVQKWGRFTIAETPEQADLVMILVEGNRAAGGGGRKRVYYCRSIGSPLRSALLQSGLGSRSQGRQKWSC